RPWSVVRSRSLPSRRRGSLSHEERTPQKRPQGAYNGLRTTGHPTMTPLDPPLSVIFGATGDLMQRKLMPALYDRLRQDYASGRYFVLGVARSDLTDEAFRDQARAAIVESGLSNREASRWCAEYLFYQSL